MRLKEKVAIVTGSGSGINQAIAVRFAQEGAKVVIVDLNPEGLKSTEKLLKGVTDEVLAVVTDVTNKQSVDSMVQKAVERFGKIDILINGAGIINYAPFLELAEEDWDKVISINMKGYFLCGQAVAKVMVREGVAGKIINIGSINSEVANPDTVHYCASKGGVLMMTKAMAVDLAQYSINVNAIAPGVIVTKLTERTRSNPAKTEAFLNKTAFKRFGAPEDVANVATFLASSEASYVTGSMYHVDGGWLAQ